MLLAPDHPAYPVRLANLEPKRTLTTSGPLDHTGIAVAIVGSREPIPEAVAFTRDLARRLARANVLVLSGGAAGIDSAAHEAALENGTTWCVAPSGRDRPFPEENAELFARIAASERSRMIWPFPDDQGKTTETPKQRNAILVALAKVVVVVQAHVQSGSRNAITHARRMRKPLFIVPAAPWTTSFGGSLWELCRGARIRWHTPASSSVTSGSRGPDLGRAGPFRRKYGRARRISTTPNPSKHRRPRQRCRPRKAP